MTAMRSPWIAVALLSFALAGCAAGPEAADTPQAVDPSPTPAVDQSKLNELLAESDIPPKPSPEKAAAFVAALEGINPELVEDRSAESLVSRGRDQCATIKDWPGDEAKWTWWAQQRFTSPQRPEGYDAATANRIIKAARKYICPSY